MIKREKPRSSEEWRSLIAEFDNSGMTRIAWCTERGINDKTMCNWTRKLKAEAKLSSANTWVEVKQTKNAITQTDKTSSIRFKLNGATFVLDNSFDANLLTRVLKVVSAL
jgi:hypothetical protein